MRGNRSEFVTVIVTAVGAIEPHLSHDDVRTAIEGMGLSAAQLQRLSRTLRRDGSVLTGPGGSDCAADIEQLILCLRQLGAMRVRAPRCAQCGRNDSETYSRKLKKRICRACSMQGWQPAVGECPLRRGGQVDLPAAARRWPVVSEVQARTRRRSRRQGS